MQHRIAQAHRFVVLVISSFRAFRPVGRNDLRGQQQLVPATGETLWHRQQADGAAAVASPPQVPVFPVARRPRRGRRGRRRKFDSIKINEVKGGCNPAPLSRKLENEKLVIQIKDIEQGRQYFNFDGKVSS